eukprot:1192964-Pleurochrysis_carterae.AAC.1
MSRTRLRCLGIPSRGAASPGFPSSPPPSCTSSTCSQIPSFFAQRGANWRAKGWGAGATPLHATA